MAEVGKFAVPKVHEKYETGQFFLHRVFGYRGVILFPWRAKIYDRNTYTASYDDSTTENTSSNVTETDKSKAGTVNATTATTDEGDTGVKDGQGTARKRETTETDSTRNDGKKEVSVDIQTYYQVLIDSRDCPHVVSVFN